MKKHLALILTLIICLSLCSCNLITPKQDNPESTTTEKETNEKKVEKITNELIYTWLVENGKLIDGTTLSYEINGKSGAFLTVSSREDKNATFSYTAISEELEETIGMTLVSDNKLSFSCKIVDKTGTGKEYTCKLDKETFTTNSPIEVGDCKFIWINGDYHLSVLNRNDKYFVEYYSGEVEIPLEKMAVVHSIDNISSQLTQQTICDMLDLMGSDLCELWEIKLADLGFNVYTPTQSPAITA